MDSELAEDLITDEDNNNTTEEANNNEIDDENSEEAVEDRFDVEKIVNVKFDKELKYRVRWLNYKPSEDTWEPESSFTEEDSIDILNEYKAKNKHKIETIMSKAAKARGRPKKKPHWEYAKPMEELTPRELGEDDEFYGSKAGEIQNSEVKQLFDPSHKNSTTELLLAQVNTRERITRNHMRSMLSNNSSRSNSLSRESPISTPPSPLPGTIQGTSRDTHAKPTQRRRSQKAAGAPKDNKKRRKKNDSEEEKDQQPDNSLISLSPSVSPEIIDSSLPSEQAKGDSSSSVVCLSDGAYVEDSLESGTAIENDLPSDYRSSTPSGRLIRRRMDHILPKPILPLDLNWGAMAEEANRIAREKISKKPKQTLTPGTLKDIIKNGDLFVLEAARVRDTEHLANLLRWKDPTTKQNFLHLLCTHVKCNGLHTADDMLDILCEVGPPELMSDFDGNGQQPIHIVVENGTSCRLSRLLMHRSRINDPAKSNGATALSIAYMMNDPKKMKSLLQAGACFTALEHEENKKPDTERRRRAYEVLSRHSNILTRLAQNSRKKVLEELTEIQTVSPIFTAPFSEGNEFKFRFHYTPIELPTDDLTFLLFLYVGRFDGQDTSEWTMRCWTGLWLQQAPTLNEDPMQNAQFFRFPMVFFAPLVAGTNCISIAITPEEKFRDVLVAQVVLVKRQAPNVQTADWAGASGLEVAPLVGPL